MKDYCRITTYHPEQDICAIIDSYGLFEKQWMFSSVLVKKGFKIIAVTDGTKFDFGNVPPIQKNKKQIVLRACAKGKPKQQDNHIEINGKHYTLI